METLENFQESRVTKTFGNFAERILARTVWKHFINSIESYLLLIRIYGHIQHTFVYTFVRLARVLFSLYVFKPRIIDIFVRDIFFIRNIRLQLIYTII